jgi:isoleucyl-tRNA synthetase
MEIAGTSYDVNKDMVDIRISSKEGFNVGSENNNFVILNTTLTEDLILEGLARECVSKVQQLRKNNDFNIVDRINLYYFGDEDFDKCISKFDKYIKDETLSLSITKDESLTESFDLNGHDVKLKVEKVG